jgi:hypothetical protein
MSELVSAHRCLTVVIGAGPLLGPELISQATEKGPVLSIGRRAVLFSAGQRFGNEFAISTCLTRQSAVPIISDLVQNTAKIFDVDPAKIEMIFGAKAPSTVGDQEYFRVGYESMVGLWHRLRGSIGGMVVIGGNFDTEPLDEHPRLSELMARRRQFVEKTNAPELQLHRVDGEVAVNNASDIAAQILTTRPSSAFS